MKLILKILLPLVVLGAAGGLVTFLIKNKQELKPQPRVDVLPLVEVKTIKPGPHRLRLHSQGEVMARTEINLVSEVTGKVVSVSTNFAAGGFFESGDLLLQLDRRNFEVALAQAEAAAAQARVRLERERAEAKVAQKEWESLGKGEANPLLLRQPQLAEAEAAVAAAVANVSKAKLDLSRCEVRAPFAGRVREKLADIGQFIAMGSPLARIYAVDYAEVRLPIPLEDIGFADLPWRDDQPAAIPVTLKARLGGESHEWRGTIVRTAGAIDRRTRMMTVIARVNDPYGLHQGSPQTPLPVGLFVEAEIEGRELQDIYRVPRSAIRGRETLLVVNAENKLQFRKAEIVRRLENEVLVKRGLQAGDRVSVSVLEAPVDGMDVRATELNEDAE